MKLKKQIGSILTHPYLMLALRLFLAWSFFSSGWEKINNLDSFVTIVKAYEILPEILAQIFATVLPFVELLVAAWFLIGFLPKFTSALTALMLLSFMIATVVNLIRGNQIESCGCFDLREYEEGFGWHTFWRQIGYVVITGLIFWGRHTFLSLDAWLQRRRSGKDQIEAG